jgi:hypothetical protein
MEAYFRTRILSIARPFLVWFGNIPSLNTRETRVNEQDYLDLEKILEPGDVIVTRTSLTPTNLLIPGFYKHVGIYTFPDSGVVEALGRGVVLTSLKEFITTKDYFCVLRSTQVKGFDTDLIAEKALQYVGYPYDYHFDPHNENFYCAELVWHAYHSTVPDYSFVRREILDVATVLPNDFYAADKKWTKIISK